MPTAQPIARNHPKTPRPAECAKRLPTRVASLGAALLCACAAGSTEEPVAGDVPSFKEYLASLPRVPDTGAYIVEGDIAIRDVERVRDFYEESISASALTIDQFVNASGLTVDNKYPRSRRLNLTYCVSDRFRDFFSGIDYKDEVVAALNTATADWESATRLGTASPTINFIHITGQDATCTAANPNVFFSVEPAHLTAGIAAAFQPDDARLDRRLLLTDDAIEPNVNTTVTGVLRHELGHVLGFRHEHVRHPRRFCAEGDTSFRGISPYEPLSVMHYRAITATECDDDGSREFRLTAYDRASARCIYTVTSTEVEVADACKGVRISAAADQFTGDWNGNVYRLGRVSTGVISRFSGDPGSWSTLSTQAGTRAILAGGSTLYKIRDSDGAFSRWNGSGWTALPAFGADVVIGYQDGAAYRLASNGTIARMSPTATTWTTILSSTATGRSLFRGLRTVFRRDSNGSIHRWSSGTTWVQVATSASSVAQDAIGRIYTLDSAGTVRLVSGSTSSVIGSNMTRLRGGLNTLYASPTSSTGTVRRWRGSTNWADHALNVSQFFAAGTRKLARMSGTGGTVSGELVDYLYPTQ